MFNHYDIGSEGFAIPQQDKKVLKEIVFEMFDRILQVSTLRKTFKLIVSRLVKNEYPDYWNELPIALVERFKASQSIAGLQTPLMILDIVLERYQAELDEKRLPLDQLAAVMFPFLENVTCKIDWDTFDNDTKVTCILMCKCYFSVVYTQIGEYFDANSFKAWMFFFKKVLDQRLPPACLERPALWEKVIEQDSNPDWRLKYQSVQCICRVLLNLKSLKKKSSQRVLAIRDEFLGKYAAGFMESCVNYICLGLEVFVSPRTIVQCFKYLFFSLQVSSISHHLASFLDKILFEVCIPMLATNQKDEENWVKDPAGFLYSQESRIDGHNIVKYASKDLVDQILRLEDQSGISMVKKMIDFIKMCFSSQTNPRTNLPLTQQFKDCLFSLLIHCFKTVKEEDELLNPVNWILENLIVNEFATANDLLRCRLCSLYAVYGCEYFQAPENILKICKGIEDSLSSPLIIIQVNGLNALHTLCADERIIAHFSKNLKIVLQLIIKCMNALDYKELVYASEGIIKFFDQSVLPFANDLFHHFYKSFYVYLQHAKTTDEDEDSTQTDDTAEEEDDEENFMYESLYAAEACLGALLSLLQLELDQTMRLQTEGMVATLMCDILLEKNNDLFLKSLGLLNFVLFKTQQVSDALKFFFPVLCYILNAKPQSQPLPQVAALPEQFQRVLIEVDFSAISEGVLVAGLGCLLNYVSKLGAQLFTVTDYFGQPFATMLFDATIKITKDALTTNSDTQIVFILRVLIGILEHSKENYAFPSSDNFLRAVFDLCEIKRTDNLSLLLLQTISMFVWHNPAHTIQILQSSGKAESFYQTLYSKLDSFTEETAMERVLYGLISLLTLDENTLKVVLL